MIASDSQKMKAGLLHSLLAGLILLTLVLGFQAQPVLARAPARMSVFASGLNNPRGLKFGPDGYLYVAEGGTGGTNSTAGQCTQVPGFPGPGPDTGGKTARISKISRTGHVSTVVDGLPSTQINPKLGTDVMGVGDVAFVRGQLYAVLAGGGCSHGNPDIPNGVIQVNPNGTWKMIANLSAFQMAHPVAHPNPPDFEPDGTWYSMVAVDGALYAVEPNHGELDRITTDGKISRVVDISASQGHFVPTSLDYYHGSFFVGNLTDYPLPQGAAKILKIGKNGSLSVFKTGFTFILAALHDDDGALYVLESSVGVPFPTAGTGQIVRVDKKGHTETIVTGLTFPSAMTFGPDGNLYVSNFGYDTPAGAGQVVKIDLH